MSTETEGATGTGEGTKRTGEGATGTEERIIDECWELPNGQSLGYIFKSLANELISYQLKQGESFGPTTTTATLSSSNWIVFTLVIIPEIPRSLENHPYLETHKRCQEPCTKDQATQMDLLLIKDEDEDSPLHCKSFTVSSLSSCGRAKITLQENGTIESADMLQISMVIPLSSLCTARNLKHFTMF